MSRKNLQIGIIGSICYQNSTPGDRAVPGGGQLDACSFPAGFFCGWEFATGQLCALKTHNDPLL
jgi:hypothetical protein